MEWQRAIDSCKVQFAEQKDVDKVIAILRASKFSKTDCIKAVIDVCGLTLAEAKEAVHFSPVWSDTRDADERFHSDLLSNLKK